MQVTKRDGRTEKFNSDKIKAAMQKAFTATQVPVSDWDLDRMTEKVVSRLPKDTVHIEQIQDTVEVVLSEHFPKVAKAYILYRQKRAEQRAKKALTPDPAALADYIHPAKYGKWIPELKRRETYEETVERVFNMYHGQAPQLADELEWAKQFVLRKEVLPSMRCMQFAGPRIEQHNAAVYNCSFSLVDRPRFFAEALYLLLCGCGVGFSVRKCHIKKLPKVIGFNEDVVMHWSVQDTIEGWADAIDVLFDSAFNGYYVEFDYSLIRPKGSPLRTSGGRAPGHLPLKRAIERIRQRLDWARGRHLRPLEVHDMVCFLAECVLSGGIRRSSLISIFDPDDEEMRECKTPKVFRYPTKTDPEGLNAQRAMANNSAALSREHCTRQDFVDLFNSAKNYGDPGFVFVDHEDYGCNPCAEIGLHPVIDGKTGWAFCNLCEVNVARSQNEEHFLDQVKAATIIGTVQATYTSFPYLGEVTEAIAKRDALLGVGLMGVMDNVKIGLNPETLRRGARVAVDENVRIASKLGINPAARVTTVKPGGTAPLVVGGVGSGRHRHHARRYIRRVTANPLEPVAQYFRSINPHMVEEKPNGDWSIMFPIKAPEGAPVEKESSAVESLKETQILYENWILPGTTERSKEISPGLHHNVSSTITVSDHEWDDLLEALWNTRWFITAVSFLPRMNDKSTPFMPREEIIDGNPKDEALWEELITKYKPVDYTKMVETEDYTAHGQEAACAGGACEIVEASAVPSALGAEMVFMENAKVGGDIVAVGRTPVSGKGYALVRRIRR